ncbi:MAG: prepilin-type N-terminal cleavage/methylation domain-containing protein [Verrucomicrobia bacterium]|nr:MAG: prepilin-type N-terminal cleavage/methylation domain-containing protein [Verrucomicrobiota bacterium]
MKPFLRSRRPPGAFTLLEVLVALSIFALVLSLLYGSWRILISSNAAALKLAATAQRSRMTIHTIEEALNSAVFFNANARHYAFLTGGEGSLSAVSFVAHLSDAFPASGYFDGERVRRVTFTVEPGRQGGSDLVLRQNSLLAPPDSDVEGHPTVLAHDVSLFELSYWDMRRGEFTPEWRQSNALPALVQVTVGFGQRGRGREPAETLTRIIRIPSAGVAGEAQAGSPGGVR